MKSLLSLFFFLPFLSFGQTGGTTTFSFLDYTYNARCAALAGDFITVKDQDVNLALMNPSLINPKMVQQYSINQSLLAGGIIFGQFTTAFASKHGIFVPHIRYVDYGTFQRTEVNGTSSGEFRPFEGVIGLSFGKQLNQRISIGISTNFIFSQLENYSSIGASMDLAGAYQSEDSSFLVTALVKHAGVQLKTYVGSAKQALPTDFQLGISKRLAHAPFRFSLLTHHWNKWDLSYRDPKAEPTVDFLTGDTIPVAKASFGEKLGRHFSYQLEVLASENLHIRLGFDYQRRQEMKLALRPGLSGFSTGFGFYFKRLRIDYGCTIYSRAGFGNTLTLSSSPSSWRK